MTNWCLLQQRVGQQNGNIRKRKSTILNRLIYDGGGGCGGGGCCWSFSLTRMCIWKITGILFIKPLQAKTKSGCKQNVLIVCVRIVERNVQWAVRKIRMFNHAIERSKANEESEWNQTPWNFPWNDEAGIFELAFTIQFLDTYSIFPVHFLIGNFHYQQHAPNAQKLCESQWKKISNFPWNALVLCIQVWTYFKHRQTFRHIYLHHGQLTQTA